jgi:lysophospholipase L1-like esterase
VAGFKFDTVGSQYDCGNHEGHSGWTVEDLLALAPTSFMEHSPDIVLIQAGTNDLYYTDARGANVSGTLARHDALLNATFSLLPTATVLLSGVTWINATRCLKFPAGPCPPDMQPNILALNAALPAMAAAYAARGFHVAVHDPNPAAAWVAADYYTWGIHFSESGYTKLGAAWWKQLQPVLETLL